MKSINNLESESGIITEECLINSIVLDEDHNDSESEETLDSSQKQQLILSQARTLKLSLNGIKRIDNLVGLKQLQKLSLNNNQIATITGLDHLPRLKSLDLSFNKISAMEGLESLVLLVELSLFHNKIQFIAGLEHCKNLKSLSLGKNRIQSLYPEGLCSDGYDDDDKTTVKSVLSCLPQLKDLNLQENPICEHKDYHSQVLKCASNVTYLDNMNDLSSYECDFVAFMTKWKEHVQEMIIHEKDDDTRTKIESIYNEAIATAKTFCQEMMKQNDREDDESQLEIKLESNINNLTEELLTKHQEIKMSLKDKGLTSLTPEIENNEIFIRATDKMMDFELKYIQEVDSMEKEARSTLEASFASILSKIGEIQIIEKEQHKLRQTDGSAVTANKNDQENSLHIQQMDSFKNQAVEMVDAIQHQITLCINKSYCQHGERINEISDTTWIGY